jgi:ABC-2 type transport system permease protein
MNFFIVLRKELLELWRTKRFLIVAAVLIMFGLVSPLLAKFTPEMLKSIPDMPEYVIDMIPVPTVTDAIGQYLKNISQFGILLAVLMSMGAVAQEKERGTAAMLLVHPLPRLAFLLAKFAALGILFAVSMAVAAIGCWYYTLLLFEALPWGSFLLMNGLILLVLLVYIAVTLLCSVLARTQGMAAWMSFAGLVVVAGLGSLPRLNEYFPGELFNWGARLVLGGGDPAWAAFWIALALIAAALAAAWLVFHRQEL